MRLDVDGRNVSTFRDFVSELNRACGKGESGFGWGDLHSLQDRLHGGFCGEPPYDIVVHHADVAVSRLGHAAAVEYWDHMVSVARDGGRGATRPERIEQYTLLREQARESRGPTLLVMIVEVVVMSPASIQFLPGSRSGE